MPRVFAAAPFRYNGVDYPYGPQDIADDTLARTLVAARYVQDASGAPDPSVPPGGSTLVATAAQVAAGAVQAANLDPKGNIVDAAGFRRLNAAAKGNTLFTKYGATAYDLTKTNITIGTTSLTHSLTNDFPGFQSYTRKCVIGAAAGAQIRFTSISYTADQTTKSLALRIYIDAMPSEFLAPSNPYITVQISNTTSLGSNYSRWTFDSTYLRQGWNILKMRQADTVSSTAGAGNLPVGCAHPADIGTGFDWTGTGQYVAVQFDNMNGVNVYIDEMRRPAVAKPVLVIGFDANGASNTDDILVNKVAPLFATSGIRSYVTLTNIYELIFAGVSTQAWMRIAKLQDTFGWDVVNHTWNHGATDIGRVSTLTSLSRTSNVCTATVSGGHGFSQNKVLKIGIQGATPTDMNGVFDCTITSSTQFTYTATGADGTATGTIKAYTYLSEVLNANTAENQRLLDKEIGTISLAARANGFSKGRKVAVLPNNSVPELTIFKAVCDKYGIKYVRGYRGGYTFLDELGHDNPQNMGSFVMDSGSTTYTQLSTLQAKVQGAVDRGDHIWIFGHFIQDDEDPSNPIAVVDPDYPPGQGGNPAPPGGVSLSGYGGWWYYSQLRKLIQNTVAPLVAAGQLLVMSPSEYADYMGSF